MASLAWKNGAERLHSKSRRPKAGFYSSWGLGRERGPRRSGEATVWPEAGREFCVLEQVALVGDGARGLWEPARWVPGTLDRES